MKIRSIPACAGEPEASARLRHFRTVYPRVRGGTRCRLVEYIKEKGLSPRARGNLIAGIVTATLPRSIPACAGEPGKAKGRRCP